MPGRRSGWGSIGQATYGGLVLLLCLQPARLARAQDPAAPPQDAAYDNPATSPATDPPSRVARLSIMDGSVSIEPASVNEFSPAEVNLPLTTGDRLWTDTGAVAELEAGQLAVRLGQSTDFTVTAMTDTLAQFGVAQGSVHLRAYALDPGTTTELDTQNVAVTVLAPGDVRVDVDPDGDSTVVTVFSGEVEIDGNGLQQTLRAGQRVKLVGTDPVAAQWLQGATSDGLDRFSAERDQAYESAEAAVQSYVNPDTVGAADLAQYGTWSNDEDYGQVWYPSGVAADWQPYCQGHWGWVAPWGWTWIESEPWGFAPFHYGRWAIAGGRWGWVPGPPVVHPVYSPGLVVFVNGGNGITAWFPLGPHEPYAPWYHSTVLYRNRVNVSGMANRNAAQVRKQYRVADRDLYADPLGARQRFANRSAGIVAISQASFAQGRRASAARVRVQPDQLAGAAVLPHPLVSPERRMVAPGASRAIPPRQGRPMLTSHRDQAIRTGPYGRATPQPAPQPAASSQPAPIERRGGRMYTIGPGETRARPAPERGTANNVPSQAERQPEPTQTARPGEDTQPRRGVQPNQPEPSAETPQIVIERPQRQGDSGRPNRGQQPSQRTQPGQTIVVPPQQQRNVEQEQQQQRSPMTIEGGVRPPNPARGTERLPDSTIAPAARQMRPEGPPAEERPLYNRAVPPPARPSFDQQRDAIQHSDPGRPLTPQQLDNLRESRPAGPPQVREAAPHPMPEPRGVPPAPRSEPAPRPMPEPRGASPAPRSEPAPAPHNSGPPPVSVPAATHGDAKK